MSHFHRFGVLLALFAALGLSTACKADATKKEKRKERNQGQSGGGTGGTGGTGSTGGSTGIGGGTGTGTGSTGGSGASYYFEDFEGASPQVTVPTGWEVGDADPAMAPSPVSKVAGTTLVGPYPNNVIATLETTDIDLTSATSPMLTFQHRYDLEDGFDIASVRVSLDSGTTWARLVPDSGAYPAQSFITGENAYSGDNSQWGQEQIDLTPFAGQATVRFGFQFFADSAGPGTDLGWYLDDIEVAEGTATGRTVVYQEDFSSATPTAQRTVAGSSALWEFGTPAGGPGAPFTGTGLAATKLAGDYGVDNAFDQLETPELDLAGYTNAKLVLFHWYDIETSYDGGNVQVYDGATSTLLQPMSNDYMFVDGLMGLGDEGFSGQTNGFHMTVFDLSSYAGSSIRLRFNFGSDLSISSYYGWAIDQIYVWAE